MSRQNSSAHSDRQLRVESLACTGGAHILHLCENFTSSSASREMALWQRDRQRQQLFGCSTPVSFNGYICYFMSCPKILGSSHTASLLHIATHSGICQRASVCELCLCACALSALAVMLMRRLSECLICKCAVDSSLYYHVT